MNKSDRVELWRYNAARSECLAIASYSDFHVVPNDRGCAAGVIVPSGVVRIDPNNENYVVLYENARYRIMEVNDKLSGVYLLSLAPEELH